MTRSLRDTFVVHAVMTTALAVRVGRLVAVRRARGAQGVGAARNQGDEVPGDPPSAGTWADLSGTARDVVQARDVSGGVHFHYPKRPDLPPQELPRGTIYFVDREQALDDLDRTLALRSPQAPDAVLIIAGTAGVGKPAPGS